MEGPGEWGEGVQDGFLEEVGISKPVHNFFRDKHCIYLLSYLPTLAFQNGHTIVSSHKILL